MQKITIYTLSWCPHCNALKNYLKSKKNIKAAEDIIERTGQEDFPIISINDEIIIGFDPKKIEELLNK